MGKRQRRRRDEVAASTSTYHDPEGNALTLRDSLSDITLQRLSGFHGNQAATTEDSWHRQKEMMFEKLVTCWEIYSLPIKTQKELLGRYRMADNKTKEWVDSTVTGHFERICSS